MNRMDSIRQEIKKAYKKAKNWRRVGDQFGISEGMAWRIVNEGYEPKGPQIRIHLGLPAYELAPVCPHCGVVHVTKRCPGPVRRRKQRWADMSEDELRWALEHREEMKHADEA